MMRRIRIGVGCATLAAALIALPALAAGGDVRAKPDPRPRALFVSNHGLFVRATAGSFCVTQSQTSGLCSDSGYPLPVHGHLPVRRGDRITFNTHDRTVKRLHAQLLRVKGVKSDD